MRTTPVLASLASATAIALVVLTVAAPASAATLPPGQKITIIDALDDPGPQEGPFYSVNPANAAATPVGTGSGAYTVGVDVNDDGLGFAIGYVQVGDDYDPTLWDVDANTGSVTNPRTLIYPSGDSPLECEGIDLNQISGELLIACVDETPNGMISTINTVDAQGFLSIDLVLSGEDYQPFRAIATNPVTGVLWGFGPFDDDASFIIDRTAETAVLQAYLDNDVFGADFDRNGQLFLVSELYDGAEFEWRSLAVTDPAVGSYVFNEWFIDQSTDAVLFFVNSITVWGKLAATGSVSGAEATPVAIGSALLLLAGAAFIATSRVSRRKPV